MKRKALKVTLDLDRYHQLGTAGPTLRLPVRVPVLTAAEAVRRQTAARESKWLRAEGWRARQKAAG